MKFVAKGIIFTLLYLSVKTEKRDDDCKHHKNRKDCGDRRDSDDRQKRPNILFFLVDDMGWNDVGYHGLREIPTPNIDALAYNSIILNNYYTHPACSPSRSALMSGRLATSTGLQHVVIKDPQPVGLPLNLKTLPQHLKNLGYKTHMLGKWHLGFYKKAFHPTKRGFDSFLGFWNGETDHFFHYTQGNYKREGLYGIPCYELGDSIGLSGLSSQRDRETFNIPGKYLAELYTEEAVKIIKRQKGNKPFFLYLAHHGVHRGNPFLPVRAPLTLTNLFTNINNLTRKNFAGALTAIDRSLGDVIEALDKKRLLDNTIIVFSSDNGTPVPTEDEVNGGSCYPLRGVKVTGWEGGVRTNSFVWAKDLKNKGTSYNGLMHIVDWLPTLYSAAGGNGDEIVKRFSLDAIDHWNAITNNLPSPRKTLVLQNDTKYDLAAYRNGDMKILKPGMYPITSPDPSGYFGEPGRGDPPAEFPNDSKTAKVLSRSGDFKSTGTPIIIDCGTGTVPCDIATEYCLFNITEDPCEMRNLAQEQPQLLQSLIDELNEATKNDPPINYPDGDYASNPLFYKGYWAPWVDKPVNYNSTSC